MTTFSVSGLVQSSVLYLYSTKDEIQIDPEYQRMGEVWTEDKRQLLLDSIINGFDIPKIYFHELSGNFRRKRYKYAIIDGRQRLESIWSFIDGDYPLSDEIEYMNDPSVKLGGLTYKEMGEHYPRLKGIFDATTLSVILVRTDDKDLIEEMFSRLNEAVPLNAAEKRNAFGGPLPKAIRIVANSQFYKNRLSISNKRYQHRDLAAKFLYLAYHGKVADTKKIYLDNFVRANRNSGMKKIRLLTRKVAATTSAMDRIFVKHDRLLGSSGMVVLYFLLVKEALERHRLKKISRSKLERFEQQRKNNRAVAEKDISRADYDLLEFDRLNQTPNDGYAIENRLKTLRKFTGI